MKRLTTLVCLILCIFSITAIAQQSSITPESLRTWLTYIASDELEGRATPSAGLDKAADYIAEQFRQAGLKIRRGSEVERHAL